MEKVAKKTNATATKKVEAQTVKPNTVKKEELKKESTQKIESILNPSADARIKKLETFNRLAEKKNRIDTKLDELTNYNASNDGTQSKMEFTADNGYRFTISNPVTINALLGYVETNLFELQEKTEAEILNFVI